MIDGNDDSAVVPDSWTEKRPPVTEEHDLDSYSYEKGNSKPAKIAAKRGMLQLIDEEQCFSKDVSKYMKEQWHLFDAGFDYNLVAVFGSQSTGKSTLLNRLFQTSFKEMNESKRQQTTKGIWCDRGGEMPVLVFDVEGTDGRERGEDQDFERKSALFSLAIAEVVIVNMWENMVGLYNGANMGLLKTVFEVNLMLFGRNRGAKTLLYFVIRDHVSRTPLEVLGQTVTKDLHKIWSELNKPDELKDEQLDDYFDIQFTSLPHLLLQPERFDTEVRRLRLDFSDPSHDTYVFKDKYSRQVPADGFQHYAEGVWEKVVSNKDLDLPTQQELLAQYRCDEISAAALIPFRENVQGLSISIGGGNVVRDMGKKFEEIRTQTVSRFDEQASRYNKTVYEKKRQQLLATVHGELQTVFVGQTKNAISRAVTSFEETSAKRLEMNERGAAGGKGYSGEFCSVIKGEKTKAVEYVKSVVEAMMLKDAEWTYSNDIELLNKKLDFATARLRMIEMERIVNRAQKNAMVSYGPQVSEILADARADMWEQILMGLVDSTRNGELDLEIDVSGMDKLGLEYSTKVDGDAASANTDAAAVELQKLKRRLRQLCWEGLVKHLNEELGEQMLHMKLRNRFEDKFKYDAKGIPKVWSARDDIDGCFATAKAEALSLLPLYSSIDIGCLSTNFALKNTLGKQDYFYVAEETATGVDEALYEERLPVFQLRRFNLESSLVLLNSIQQRGVSKKFSRDADTMFLEAKRAVVMTKTQVPYWAVIMMILLGWNEAMVVLFNPLYLVVLALLGATVFVIHNLNLWGPAKMVAQNATASVSKMVHNIAVEAANATNPDSLDNKTLNASSSPRHFRDNQTHGGGFDGRSRTTVGSDRSSSPEAGGFGEAEMIGLKKLGLGGKSKTYHSHSTKNGDSEDDNHVASRIQTDTKDALDYDFEFLKAKGNDKFPLGGGKGIGKRKGGHSMEYDRVLSTTGGNDSDIESD
ncbi:Protein SEY1 [Zancudomyces culisetae]|uniref:Protein SEY1 n=1 Tax=Zancudomyces culisetae TaxID=1213189 RepID=A0A1R1PC74_ZANCU|nr:Protein SEY1 [Zancudomyces culisetae]|eukprot:OMH78541.1 Protein SEY1 [Zancudomyces culisetae]